MAKKNTTHQRKASSVIEAPIITITPDVCRLKHIAIDKEFENIKTDSQIRHEEIKSLIDSLQENIKKDMHNSNDNLKDKIVLTEKIIGDKIDSLSEFDDTLKGNGTPGVWESIRSLKWRVGTNLTLMIIILILVLGGDFRGVTFEKVKAAFGLKKSEARQIEEITVEEKTDTIIEKTIFGDEEKSKTVEEKEIEEEEVTDRQ